MSTITKTVEDAIYGFTIDKFSRVFKDKHISSAIGMENLPEKGPYIIIANHSSFADHFLLSAVYHFCYGIKLRYLTKKESFEKWHSRVWHNATGCIPVDREKTDMKSIKTIIGHIKQDRIIVIYPEGTRGLGKALMPFKQGAFKIAELMRVPIIPVGMRDANKIMPIGSTKILPHSAQLIFGEPITAAEVKQMGAEKVAKHCFNLVNEMVYGSDVDFPQRAKYTATKLAQRAKERLEEILEEGMNRSSCEPLEQCLSLAHYAVINDPENIEARIQYARAYGLVLLASSKWQLLRNASKIPALVEPITKLDSEHPFGKYILGSYYLNVPAIMGGSKKRALELIEQAYHSAIQYGIDPHQFAISYAKALIKNKNMDQARKVLAPVMARQGHNTRFVRRAIQAEEMLIRISDAA